MRRVRVAVLVPVKPFGRAKQRLAGILSPADRAVLARTVAERVLRAAGSAERFVVCNDDEVAAWAATCGATALQGPPAGLNADVGAAVAYLATLGVEHVVVAHGDLPLAHDLDRLAEPGTATIVPDRHRDGTNVLAVPTGRGFWFRYGPRSFERHQDEAGRVGLACRVIVDERLAVDVDTAADLDHPLVQEALSSIPMNRASRDSRPMVGH
jgi:2-phospho-L-lactate guanylyltransferase